jgi:hypothetical protein
MWQYPPLAAFVFGGIGLIGEQPWLFALLFIGVDIAITVLLARDARARERWHGFAIWLAAPLLLGPILYGRYDSIPTVSAIAGLLAATVPVAAAVILAVGGGLKVWPAVMALAVRQREWVRVAVGGALTVAVIAAASAWVFPSVMSGFANNGEARGLQTESVAALPFVWGRLFGRDIPEAFRYGSSEVDSPVADAIAPLLLPLTAVGLLALILARLLGRLDRAPVADIALVALVWLMVTSRVLSPQYNVWLVGMLALVWAAGSPRMHRTTLPVVVTALAAQALYPFAYIDIVDGGFVGVAIQTVRIVALVAVLVLGVRALLPADDPADAGSEAPVREAQPR